MGRKRVLYVSYDGMTDPLGESQVIPYVLGLSRRGYRFHLLSFEKRERFAADRRRIGTLLGDGGIEWVPLPFTDGPRLFAKAYDRMRLRRAVRSLNEKHSFDLVHCRSYPAADAALSLRRREGVPYLFDMRGFWVDERAEGGIWDTSLPHYRALYRYFKGREKQYLAGAAGVVSLTEAAVREMAGWDSVPELRTEVIPCAVDTGLFSRSDDPSVRVGTRRELGVPTSAVLVGYLGSLTTWYLVDEMLSLFAKMLERHEHAYFLFLTRHSAEELRAGARRVGIPPERIIVKGAMRADVPRYLEAMDASVFFIRPSYSKMASCPTKMGELMAVGVPFITNSGIGDVDRIVSVYRAGRVLPDLRDETLSAAAEGLDETLSFPREPMIQGARDYFSLEAAVDKYSAMYEEILATGDAR